jgi:hypothetical protein
MGRKRNKRFRQWLDERPPGVLGEWVRHEAFEVKRSENVCRSSYSVLVRFDANLRWNGVGSGIEGSWRAGHLDSFVGSVWTPRWRKKTKKTRRTYRHWVRRFVLWATECRALPLWSGRNPLGA